MSDEILRNYRGLDSFLDPDQFYGYLDDVALRVQEHFGCRVFSKPDKVPQHFANLIRENLHSRHFNVFIDLLTISVQKYGNFQVSFRSRPAQEVVPYIDVLTSFPSEVMAVGLAVATIRHEFATDITKCQIQKDSLANIARRLGNDSFELITDQTDLLEGCLQYVAPR